MIKNIEFEIEELNSMKKYPKELFYRGNLELLKKRKVSIVGSRKPNKYAKTLIHAITTKLAKNGVCIVSGGAIGVDTIAHKASGLNNTIMVAGTGLDICYPAINKPMIKEIATEGLLLSQFPEGMPSHRYNFPLRNELVVALGDILIVAYADKNSGTMRSVEYALKMGKEVFVLPHRLGESEATNNLLQQGKAKAIYDIDAFIYMLGLHVESCDDDFLDFCKRNPTYEEALKKDPTKLFEYELGGKIAIKDNLVEVL